MFFFLLTQVSEEEFTFCSPRPVQDSGFGEKIQHFLSEVTFILQLLHII